MLENSCILLLVGWIDYIVMTLFRGTSKEKNVSKRHELFTKVANVYYSYRKFPYEGHAVSDYEARVQQNFAAWLSRLGFYE
jgi:hypothetical protein